MNVAVKCLCPDQLSLLSKVVLALNKPREKKESPFLVFHVANLGIDTKLRKYDMCATTYIKKITMKCLEFTGQSLTGG